MRSNPFWFLQMNKAGYALVVTDSSSMVSFASLKSRVTHQMAAKPTMI